MRRRVEKQIEAVAAQTHHTLLGMLRTENKELKALCKKLAEACAYGLNLILNGIGQHSHAIALFESGLEAARKAGIENCKKILESGLTVNCKFRAWDRLCKRYWYSGFLINPEGNVEMLNNAIQNARIKAGWTIDKSYDKELTGFDFEQWTGRQDKVAKDIYEGDNLLFNVFDYNDIDKQYTGQVYWDEDDLAWNIQCKREVFSLGDIIRQDDELEIIGTIHNEEAKP